jgi:hypothetical protein
MSVFEMRKDNARLVGTKNVIFCAQRAWDQPTEGIYMKRIEDRFQEIVQPILRGKVNTIAPEQKRAIDTMFALWYMRTRFRYLDAEEVQLNGISGSALTAAQEENLEMNGYMFVRNGGKMPARQLNALELRQRIDRYVLDLAVLPAWGVTHAQSGEFIVPDVPVGAIIPLSPKLALVASQPDGTIVEADVAVINSGLKAGSREYYFSRDLSKCP